jgi:ADP-ribosylglycohydrolase
LPSRRWRWLAWLTVAFVVVGVILSAFSPDAYMGSLGPIRNPLGIEGFTSLYEALLYTVSPLLYVAVALSLLVRLRRATGVERQQLKWFAYAGAAFAIGVILNIIVLALETPQWFELMGLAYFTASGTAIPISIGIAILRYRLYDIDLLINRTIVYASLTVMLASVYFGGVATAEAILRALTGEDQQPQLAVVVSTLVIAALFNPLRRRIQSFTDRRFYRRKYDARKTLDALSGDLVGVVRETMQPSHVSMWLRPDPDPKVMEARDPSTSVTSPRTSSTL